MSTCSNAVCVITTPSPLPHWVDETALAVARDSVQDTLSRKTLFRCVPDIDLKWMNVPVSSLSEYRSKLVVVIFTCEDPIYDRALSAIRGGTITHIRVAPVGRKLDAPIRAPTLTPADHRFRSAKCTESIRSHVGLGAVPPPPRVWKKVVPPPAPVAAPVVPVAAPAPAPYDPYAPLRGCRIPPQPAYVDPRAVVAPSAPPIPKWARVAKPNWY